MENHPSDRRKVMEALIRGREFANQLLQLVNKTSGDEEDEGSIVPLAEDLVRKILRSFTNTLVLLNGVCPSGGGGEVSTMKVSDSSCRNRENLEGKCSHIQDRRHKRRRTLIPTWEKDSSTLIDDGYAWRKYGQKRVLNSNYLRNYFRCTYKFDQDCQATKQLQRIQEDPPLYRTKYYGYHTCKKLQNPDEIILDCSASPQYSSMLLNFSNSFPSKQDYTYCSSSSSSAKFEFEEVIPDYHVINNLSSNLLS